MKIKRLFLAGSMTTVVATLAAFACSSETPVDGDAAPSSSATPVATPTATPVVTSPNSAPTPQASPAMVQVVAPIESAEVMIAESFPLQYFLQVTSGLRNGCEEFEGTAVGTEGHTVSVAVVNLEPQDKNIVCTEIHRTVDSSIRLGSGLDFDPGTIYTVRVNDVEVTFETEGTPPDPNQTTGQATGTLDTPFEIKVGESVLVGRQGPVVELLEIVEDSRCPSDVVCIQAGRARILVRVSSPGDVMGFGIRDLTLVTRTQQSEGNSVEGVFDTYTLEAKTLEPHPLSTDAGPFDYMATIVVSKVAK